MPGPSAPAPRHAVPRPLQLSAQAQGAGLPRGLVCPGHAQSPARWRASQASGSPTRRRVWVLSWLWAFASRARLLPWSLAKSHRLADKVLRVEPALLKLASATAQDHVVAMH